MTDRPTTGTGALPVPEPGPEAAVAFVARHLGDVVAEGPDGVAASPAFRGGQVAADAALAAFDVAGYARARNEVAPRSRRGASALSPWIRHGLLDLPTVWAAVADGPARDRGKFRDELLWQEFARHWYARLGTATRSATRNRVPVVSDRHEWDRSMVCIDETVGELERDGWLVNQTRMWLSSHWTVRHGAAWRSGEDEFFTHLLDGSRAANRLGWQWTTGVGSNKAYGFSRWQVRKRTDGWCERCPHRHDCPIEAWPDDPELVPLPGDDPAVTLVRRDPDPDGTAGPAEPELTGDPDVVWLTAESLGDADPALAAHPDLPVAFVFDEALLASLRLSGTRLVFLTETLAELATRRDVSLWRGRPAEVLDGRAVATTFAPVPGFRRLLPRVHPVALHPWPWLARPHRGSIRSFTAWRKQLPRR